MTYCGQLKWDQVELFMLLKKIIPPKQVVAQAKIFLPFITASENLKNLMPQLNARECTINIQREDFHQLSLNSYVRTYISYPNSHPPTTLLDKSHK